MPQTKVVALERGHDGTNLREQGEVFMVDLADPRYKDVKWFVAANSPAAKAPVIAKAFKPGERPPGSGPIPGSRAHEARSLESEDML